MIQGGDSGNFWGNFNIFFTDNCHSICGFIGYCYDGFVLRNNLWVFGQNNCLYIMFWCLCDYLHNLSFWFNNIFLYKLGLDGFNYWILFDENNIICFFSHEISLNLNIFGSNWISCSNYFCLFRYNFSINYSHCIFTLISDYSYLLDFFFRSFNINSIKVYSLIFSYNNFLHGDCR